MRLLLDESVPLDSVRALRAAGHDVYAVSETSAGTADPVLLARAHADARLVITFDLDFGELAVRHRQAAVGGIMLLRLVPHDAEEVTQLLLQLLQRTDIAWTNRLSVVAGEHIRQRPL